MSPIPPPVFTRKVIKVKEKNFKLGHEILVYRVLLLRRFLEEFWRSAVNEVEVVEAGGGGGEGRSERWRRMRGGGEYRGRGRRGRGHRGRRRRGGQFRGRGRRGEGDGVEGGGSRGVGWKKLFEGVEAGWEEEEVRREGKEVTEGRRRRRKTTEGEGGRGIS